MDRKVRVAQWLNRIGVTGILLKYRVPARHKDPLWKSAVRDAQRSMRLVRAHAAQWRLDPDRMGILGFSAGGAAVISALSHQKIKIRADAIDDLSARPSLESLSIRLGWWMSPKLFSSLRFRQMLQRLPCFRPCQ